MEEQNFENNQPAVEGPANGNNPNEPKEKTSFWVMGLFLVVFLVCGGLGYCPWWMWIILVLWFFMSIGGLDKKWQAIIGVVILIWGTPIFSDDDSSAINQATQSSSTTDGAGSSSGHAQTESECREIEADFVVLQQLQQRFENAYNRHDMEEAQRISDEALDHMHRMQQKNLTAEQRQLLQSMF